MLSFNEFSKYESSIFILTFGMNSSAICTYVLKGAFE